MALYNNPHVVSTLDGDMVAPLEFLPEASSQSFKAGDLVYLVSGAVTICGADPALIYGIAMEDASGTTGTLIAVQPILPDYLVKIRVRNATTDTLSSSAVKATAYGLVTASNVWYLDLAETSADRVVVYDQVKNPDGTYTYWAVVRFISTVLQLTIGT